MTAQNKRELIGRLENIHSPLLSADELVRLYEHMVQHSELSPESIIHEIESASTRIDAGRYFFLSMDLEELSLGIEEISFLLVHNRY
ncbi:MAG TPA: hypothetical protein PK307_02295, partial [Spirochaetota bacterium]|nr:hypothetical protein [Spirochaetota bacterium]